MIKLTRLNKQKFVVNAELIEFVEQTPETILTMTTGKKIVVMESLDDVLKSVIAYRQIAFPIVRKPGFEKEKKDDV